MLSFLRLVIFCGGIIFVAGCCSREYVSTSTSEANIHWQNYDWHDQSSESRTEFYINQEYVGKGEEGLRFCCKYILGMQPGSVVAIHYDKIDEAPGDRQYFPPFVGGYSMWDLLEDVAVSRKLTVDHVYVQESENHLFK